jgi:DNA-binding response OmpR family regulator
MRILLATDQPDLGHALSLFLAEQSIDVVDVVADFDRLMDSTAASRPDVVLVDWSLGEAVSSHMVADLMHRDDPTPVIVLSTPQDRARARTTGAAAYATLGDPPAALLATLVEVGSA